METEAAARTVVLRETTNLLGLKGKSVECPAIYLSNC